MKQERGCKPDSQVHCVVRYCGIVHGEREIVPASPSSIRSGEIRSDGFSTSDPHAVPECRELLSIVAGSACLSPPVRQMLLPFRHGARHLCFGRPRRTRVLVQGLACLRHPLVTALWRDDWGDRIRGLQPPFTDSQRAVGDWRSDAIAVDVAGRGLHRARDRLRMGCVEVSRSKSCAANRGRPVGGLWIPWPAVAVCPDAPTRGAGRSRWHAERHHARRSGERNGSPHVRCGGCCSQSIRETLPPVLPRKHRCPPRVRRVDLLGCAPRSGQSPDAVDRAVGAHQHQRVPALGRGAGDGAVAGRNAPVRTARERCDWTT